MVALRFLLLRAWPVVAFSLLEGPLVVLLLFINLRRARASELIMLDAGALTVIRTDSYGQRKQQTLPCAWLRVHLKVDRGIPHVILSSDGRDCEIGAFLHEPCKLSLFDALESALHGIRHPHFDNPQLRTSELPV
jgi:uncharacterized membrane protein